MSSFTIRLAAFGCVVAGMLLGILGQFLLPDLAYETEDRNEHGLAMMFITISKYGAKSRPSSPSNK